MLLLKKKNIFIYHQISCYNLILVGCIVFHCMDVCCAIIKLTLDIYVVSFKNMCHKKCYNLFPTTMLGTI